MDRTSVRTHVNELIAIMWYQDQQMLVRVWQHDDNYVEIYPYLQKFWKLPWTVRTDMMGFLSRVRDGTLQYMTEDEGKLFVLLMLKD